jgi:CRP-like cAMP-binding protein
MSKLRELEKRLDREPENLGLRVMLATAMREAGRQTEAVELYRSVAVAYRDQGRQQQAIAVCKSILEIAPQDDRCRALLRELQGSTEQIADDEILLEVGTPPPPPERTPKPPTIPPIVTRAPTAPPRIVPIEDVLPGARTLRGTGLNAPVPRTRSSSRLDQTPLPVPLPYHVADPTTRSLKKLSEVDMIPTPDPDDDVQTRPGEDRRPGSESGLAQAARKISSALIKTDNSDLSAELDTRQRPRIESNELAKIAGPPPTVPIERLDLDDDEPEGVPTLDNEEHDEPTRPRDTPLDMMIRMENEGPIGSAFFTPLPREHRDTVLRRFHKKSVKKGTTIIRQGEIGHSLVVVIKGHLEVKIDRKGGIVQLGAIGLGDFVGEGSLLARTPSPVHVYAAQDCELLVLPPRDFYELAAAFPALWAELKDVAERRKRDLEMMLKRTTSSP